MKYLSIPLASIIIMIALAVPSSAGDTIKDLAAYKILSEGEPLEVSITLETGYNSIKAYEGKIYHCWTEEPADAWPTRCYELSDQDSFDYTEIWHRIINPK